MSLIALDDNVAALLHRLCEETATEQDICELESLALADERIYQAYLQYFAMHGSLCLGQGATSANSQEHAATLPLPFNLQAHTVAAPGDAAPINRSEEAVARPAPVTVAHRFALTAGRLAAALVVVGLVGYFVMLVVALSSEYGWRGNARDARVAEMSSGSASESVASITSADCKWSPNAPRPLDKELTTDTPLCLERGVVSVSFANGAEVVLEGPCEFLPQSGARGFLKHGRLIARVSKAAIGFTIDTPSARIVDLGTEFAVDAKDQDVTEVEVLKGEIELRPGNANQAAASTETTIKLSAGEARRIEKSDKPGAFVTTKIVTSPGRFVDESKPENIRVKRTFASSTFPSDRLHSENLIRGRGLSPSGRHTAEDQANAYWHTEMGKVQGEFVAFELPKQYTLSIMKVWNYNQPGWCWRGVKQADVYVSDSGVGDPLKQPNEWRQVVSKQQFMIAPGNSEYDRPDMISLHKCKARFVAIVIDKIHAEGTSAEVACAGLSEVQFFGTPTERDK